MELFKSMMVAASGMRVQSNRMRTVAENMANANSTALGPGAEPYRRQIPTFESFLDKETGLNLVRTGDAYMDQSPFGMKYNPNHPAADENGYIQTPNVNVLVEMVDMRDAQKNFEANLKVIESSRNMLLRTVDLLRT